jgi:acyl-CoA reductase-like NAD-dependent aldehyde dehydrogenase
MIGKSLIAGTPVDATDGTFTAGGALAQFEEASGAHVDRALEAAAHAFDSYRGRLRAGRGLEPEALLVAAGDQRGAGRVHCGAA